MGRECIGGGIRVSQSPNRGLRGEQLESRIRFPAHLPLNDDVVFYVGQIRKPYSVSAETLIRSSAYFRSMLSTRRPAASPAMPPPIIMDCEEIVFECLLLLMRYGGAWEALPPLSQSHTFRLKKEAELYGVPYTEPPPKTALESPTTSPTGSPKSLESPITRPPPPCRRLSGRLSDGIRIAGSTSRQLAELPYFPLDLSDPTKLVLVSCIDDEKAPIYACEHCRRPAAGASRASTTQWALSFHYRHAFCTCCGRPPAKMSPKFFAEMFTGAAAQYSQSTTHEMALQVATSCKWVVGSDSTCLLRLVSSLITGPDACSSATCAAASRTTNPPTETVWAGTYFYSHAFCTRCGQAAHESALLSVLLALRYGGAATKGSSKFGRSSFKIPTSPPADG